MLRRDRLYSAQWLSLVGPGEDSKLSVSVHLLASAPRMDRMRRMGSGLGVDCPRIGCCRQVGSLGNVRRRHLRGGAKRGVAIGATKCGKGMKLEVVVDRTGVPIGKATDAANVAEVDLVGPAVDSIPSEIDIPSGTPLIEDAAYDSDPHRDDMAAKGFKVISPHRKNRVRPSRNDGRTFRRYKRRYIVERTFAWFHSFRRVMTRYEYKCDLYDGFFSLACAFLAITRL
jgi:transposase